MHSLNNRGVHTENLRILPNCDPNKMDYRQKVIVPSPQIIKHEDEDDEDLDALRLAALKSLGAKHMPQNTHRSALLSQQVKSRAGYLPCPSYNHQRQPKRGFYQNRPPRQNGNTYYPSRVNQNLIEIVPVEEEEEATRENDVPPIDPKKLQTESPEDGRGDSKFYRYKDNQSGSEEEDNKESANASTAVLPPSESEWPEKGGGEGRGLDRDIPSGLESPRDYPAQEEVPKEALPGEDDAEVVGVAEQEEEEEEEEVVAENEEEDQEEEEEKPANDDDDDVLLMADLEEEDSLERLMDEMEREMNKLDETKDKKPAKKESKESKKVKEVPKVRSRKSRVDQENERNGPATGSISNSSWTQQTFAKSERRSVSPRAGNKTSQKRRSLSPKARLRKKSPRRSPRRSPLRASKKSFRDGTRMKSPRKLSPVSSRFSPRPRSPKSSPRGRSPSNRSPLLRRSPSAPRKLSPRGRSPHSRSPKIRRSRSPRLISRSRSPASRLARSPAPRLARSPAPRLARSPASRLARSPKCTKRSKSPKISRSRTPRPRTSRSNSPRMMSPSRTSSPRCRSPRASPGRLASSPRPRSPKLTSPERRRGSPARTRSPIRHSPAHRSPWSSPRNSPRLSPRRRRSPKESTRKTRQRSITPDVEAAAAAAAAAAASRPAYKREPTSPLRKTASSSPDVAPRSKGKQKDPLVANSGSRDNSDAATNDPILEARRRKFECTKPIDPVQDNKKIKLSKRECTSKTCIVTTEDTGQLLDSPKSRKTNKLPEDVYSDVPETDLCLTEDYVYDVLEVTSDESSAPNTVAMCVEMVPVKLEKERSKKKKKRDKEIYQVGKLKGELPLSERICKEKKWKNRNDRDTSPLDSSPERAIVLEDMANDGEEEADLRTELSRRRAERLNRVAPMQSARLLQSAFKGVVNEVAKNNAKATQRHADKGDDKNSNKKEVRRVTVLHRTVTDLADSEDEAAVDSKVPIRFRLGINKPAQENNRESKTARKSSKRQGRKVKHKNMSLSDQERKHE